VTGKLLIPISGCTGVAWPAVPPPVDSYVFSVLRQLEESQWWPAETLLAQQLLQAERLLAHAAATVPFYADRLRFLRGTRAGSLSLEMFRRIPVLRRAQIQEAGSTLLSTKIPPDHGAPFDIRTSGSTGRPISVKGTAITSLMTRAANMRYHLWFKRDFSAKSAAIRMLKGAELDAAKADQPIRWADGFPSGPMVLRQITTPVGEQLDWLLSQDSAYLLTFPSNLESLIRLSQERQVRPASLREVATVGEALDEEVRKACETVWGVPLVDAYSAQEFGYIAVQCPDHRGRHYHVNAEMILVEIVNEEGAPVAPGDVGRLVLTDLHNFATPLIRYEIGDLAELGAPCGCGRGLPMVARVLGRTRNMLVLPSGEKICPRFTFESFLFSLPIKQFQVIQESRQNLVVRLVTERPLKSEEEARVKDSILVKAGHPFDIRIDYVPVIPRAASGKFEEFHSEVAV